jgi:hypothetical protein
LKDTKVKFKPNSSGIRALLQSQMMMDAVQNQARSQGEVEHSFVGFDRVQVIVKTEGSSHAD